MSANRCNFYQISYDLLCSLCLVSNSLSHLMCFWLLVFHLISINYTLTIEWKFRFQQRAAFLSLASLVLQNERKISSRLFRQLTPSKYLPLRTTLMFFFACRECVFYSEYVFNWNVLNFCSKSLSQFLT